MPPSNHASTYRQGEDSEGLVFYLPPYTRQTVLLGCLMAKLSGGVRAEIAAEIVPPPARVTKSRRR